MPLATAFLLLYCWCGGWEGETCAASSPSLLELSSSLPDELSESDELLPLLLLICSIISTSALSSEIKGIHLVDTINRAPWNFGKECANAIILSSTVYHTKISHMKERDRKGNQKILKTFLLIAVAKFKEATV